MPYRTLGRPMWLAENVNPSYTCVLLHQLVFGPMKTGTPRVSPSNASFRNDRELLVWLPFFLVTSSFFYRIQKFWTRVKSLRFFSLMLASTCLWSCRTVQYLPHLSRASLTVKTFYVAVISLCHNHTVVRDQRMQTSTGVARSPPSLLPPWRARFKTFKIHHFLRFE